VEAYQRTNAVGGPLPKPGSGLIHAAAARALARLARTPLAVLPVAGLLRLVAPTGANGMVRHWLPVNGCRQTGESTAAERPRALATDLTAL